MESLLNISQAALLSAGIVLAVGIAAVLWLPFGRTSKDAPPRARLGMPLFGNLAAFFLDPVAMVQECYKKYGGVFTVPMIGANITFLIGPEEQTPFFKLDDGVLSPRDIYKGSTRPIFGPNVLYSAAPKMGNQQIHRLVTTLRSSSLKSYVAKIDGETRAFLTAWGQTGEVDLYTAFSELMILTACRCLHGDDVREHMFGEVARHFQEMSRSMTTLGLFMPDAPVPAHFRRDKARKEMVALFSSVIQKRRAAQTDGSPNAGGKDILQVLMDMKYTDGTSNTEEQIAGLLIMLLFAGQHTSSTVATWTTLHTVGNPELLARILKEQEQVLGDDPEAPLTWEQVDEMALLYDCIRETTRMHPPAATLMRLAKKAFTVTSKGRTYTVPKGHIVGVSTHVSMRLPDVFEDPDKFDPDRYGPGREEHKRRFALIGFGGGSHLCLGEKFAYVQIKTIISVLLREYDIELIGDFPEPDFSHPMVKPKGSCRVRYTRRVELSKIQMEKRNRHLRRQDSAMHPTSAAVSPAAELEESSWTRSDGSWTPLAS